LKKIIALFAVLLSVFTFSSCSGKSIEEMLVAPSLTEEQSAILGVLESSTTEKTVLKYPESGNERYPIQFYDLNGDGEKEAVVLYSIPALGVLAHIAVMQKSDDDSWVITSDVEGVGANIYSLRTINLTTQSNKYLLVQWSSVSGTDKLFTVYNFSGGLLKTGFEEDCCNIIVTDVDADGEIEFCYITNGTESTPFKLKIVDDIDKRLAVTAECDLNSEMLSCVNLISGFFLSGSRAIFVDENIGNGNSTTEVFSFVDDSLIPSDGETEYDFLQLACRKSTDPDCTELRENGATLIPSATSPDGNVMFPDRWVYWYSINDGSVVNVANSYYDEDYGMVLTVPHEWLYYSDVVVDYAERKISVCRFDSGEELVSVKILTVNETADSELLSEYELATWSGPYRYYIKYNCSSEDRYYISSYFKII